MRQTPLSFREIQQKNENRMDKYQYGEYKESILLDNCSTSGFDYEEEDYEFI